MRHAAHKARNAQRPAILGGVREDVASGVASIAAPTDIIPEVVKFLNESAPSTRRAIRQMAKRRAHRKQFATAGAFTLLAATAGSFVYAANAGSSSVTPFASGASTSVVSDIASGSGDDVTSATDVEYDRSSTVSRSADRVPVESATDYADVENAQWSMTSESDSLDVSQMSKSLADNPNVAALMERDSGSIPDGFDPNHATGDSGNAYSFSQCTWWVYVRRHQLGLPVGSHFGNGAQWADSARALGYWVDNTPRVGDIMVFARGQEGANAVYGHVAVVEDIVDGKVITSECGAVMNGTPYSKEYSNVGDFQYIHY